MADAQYIIDIAAEMPDGEATIAELDALTKKLMGGGKNADDFQRAIKRVSGQLDVAKQAAVSANVELKTGEARYAELERAAVRTAKAAERAALKGAVPPEVAAAANAARRAVDDYTGTLRKLEVAAEGASKRERDLSRSLGNLRKISTHVTDQLGEATTKVSTFRGALGDVGGPVGELGERLLFPVQAFVDLNEQFGKSAALSVVAVVGITAIIAVIIALAAAAALATAAVAALSVKLADNARSAGLAREALEQLHPELQSLRGEWKAITDETGVAETRLQALSKSLLDAKVSAADLPAALRAAATAEAALGQGGADKFIADMKAGKLSVEEFAATTQTKFGGIVSRQLLGLEAQGARFKRVAGSLFGGLDIEPALLGLRTLIDLFDENTVAGKTIKFLFESIFQPLINQAQNAAYAIEAFALGFLIGLTKVYIAVKPAIKVIGEFFGFEDTSLESLLGVVTKAGEYAAYAFVALAAVFAGLVAAIGAVVAAGAALTAWFVGMFVLVNKAAIVVAEGLVGAFNTAVEWIRGIDFAQIGIDIIQGLASGITSGAGFIVGAMKRAVSGAISSAKSLLGIASPSKVFMSLGTDTGQGFVAGIEAKSDEADRAMGNLVEPPDVAQSPLARLDAASPGGSGAGNTVNNSSTTGGKVDLSGATFVFNGVEGAEDAESRFAEVLTRILEGDAAQLGGATA